MKDNVTYSFVLQEFDSEKGGWMPYTAEDVQVRFNLRLSSASGANCDAFPLQETTCNFTCIFSTPGGYTMIAT